MGQAIIRLTLLCGNCWVGPDAMHPAWRPNPPVAFRVCDMWASEQAGRGWSTTVYQIEADVPLFERWGGGPSPLKSVLKCVNLGKVGSRYIHLRLCYETSLTNVLPWWLSWERTHLPTQETKETRVQSLGQEDPLEEATTDIRAYCIFWEMK